MVTVYFNAMIGESTIQIKNDNYFGVEIYGVFNLILIMPEFELIFGCSNPSGHAVFYVTQSGILPLDCICLINYRFGFALQGFNFICLENSIINNTNPSS